MLLWVPSPKCHIKQGWEENDEQQKKNKGYARHNNMKTHHCCTTKNVLHSIKDNYERRSKDRIIAFATILYREAAEQHILKCIG